MGEMVKGGLMITDSADWTDVRRRTRDVMNDYFR